MVGVEGLLGLSMPSAFQALTKVSSKLFQTILATPFGGSHPLHRPNRHECMIQSTEVNLAVMVLLGQVGNEMDPPTLCQDWF